MTWYGEVINPTKSVVYQGDPQARIFPKLRINRENWFINSFSAGIEWRH